MRVITLNTANYDDHLHWDQRVLMIAADIVARDADVIALQEIRFDPSQASTQVSYQNMGEQIIAAIRGTTGGDSYENTRIATMPSMYYPIVGGQQTPWQYPSPGSPNGDHQLWEGLTILSKPSVTTTGGIYLTRTAGCGDGNLRATQFAEIATPARPLFVFNTHFGLDGPCLTSNASETVAYMGGFEGLQLLVGDFNAEPDNDALNLLRSAGLTDIWAALHPDDPGYTWPSGDPAKRIDYCWANGALHPQAVDIELIATEPDNGVYASDHYGLCVTLHLED